MAGGAKLSKTRPELVLGDSDASIGVVEQGSPPWQVEEEGSATETVQEQMLLELRRIRRLLEIWTNVEVGDWDGQ